MNFTPKDIWRSLTSWQWLRGRFSKFYFFQMFGTNDVQIFVDTDNAEEVYNGCSLWFVAVNRLCEILSNCEVKAVRKLSDGTEEEISHPALELIKNPNPLESQEAFIKNCFVNYFNYANLFIKKTGGEVSGKIRALYNLPPSAMKIEFSGSVYEKLSINDIIKSFILIDSNGQELRYTPQEVIYFADNFSFKEGKGITRLRPLNLTVNNAVAIERTQNMLIVSGGIKGFMSSESAEGIAANPINRIERERIEKDFNERTDLYSADQNKIKIVEANAKWNPMGYPIRDLILDEQSLTLFSKICAALGLPKELFPFTGATYENQKEAIKNAIQNTAQPILDSFFRKLSVELGMSENEYLIADYSYLPLMKEDELKAAQTYQSKIQSYSILYRDGVISQQEYAYMAEVEASGDGIIKQNNNGKQ